MKKILSFKKTLIGLSLVLSLIVFEYLLEQSKILNFISHEIYRAKEALANTPLSENSVWNQSFLQANPIIKEKIEAFESGKICSTLKNLDNKSSSYEEITSLLKQSGYIYTSVPLRVNAKDISAGYYLKNGSVTQNANDPNVMTQEIYYNEDGCIVRIKLDGIPGGFITSPHSIKAVLIDPKAPINYENEAFKITWDGKPVPKGPLFSYGMKSGLSKEEQMKQQKSYYIDYIMQECHPELND